ncbi:hypothetical protein [Pedobacter cryoconitis]|uniref:Uncharacterized protein n=1 Tax=Pedobacter cryoconitis TaxID=188932 RepID=A0A7X0J3V7_9SPHI|nr:hypothetical protein [Pedobacter cryoconitis]MBB6500638.1 hypothetical protein [Pedobacter cryoconitis]
MRRFLLIIVIFFITNSCFALKPGQTGSVCQPEKEIKPLSLHYLFKKPQLKDVSSLNGDDFEHSGTIQQALTKQPVVCLQLFYLPEDKLIRNSPLRTINLYTRFHYNFIYDFLYPNHVFW